MTRDYKGKRKPARGRSRRKDREVSPAQFLLAGFSLGVIAAAITYYVLTPAPPKRPKEPVPTTARPPASSGEDADARTPEPAPAKPAPNPEPEVAPENDESSSPRYAFWELLQDYEVILPEDNEQLEKAPPVEQVAKPGTYLLQVGAFRRFADADRLKAQLALNGIETHIKKVIVDDREIHRVRIGPETDLGRINQLREQLARQNINVLLIRIAG
ncbi:MAG: SPOR domain-containing protein [Pseudomonadota bacterium]